MTDVPPRVRPATPFDAPAIARIRVASWRATYAGIVPDAILKRMDVGRNEAWIAERIANPGDRGTLVVEDAPGAVIGYALIRPADDEDAAGLGQVQAIYLDPDAQGRGFGVPLLDAAITSLAAAGFGSAVLWVLADNHRARRFYEHAGFTPDGAGRTLDFDGTPIEEIRYRRTIG